MRKGNWGFLPILLLWVLICNEFIQAQHHAPPAPPAPAADTQSATSAPATPFAPATRPPQP